MVLPGAHEQMVRRLRPLAVALGASSHCTAGAGEEESAAPTGGGKSYAEWVADENTIRIPLQTLVAEYVRVLKGIGMAPDRAALVARLIGDNQKDGVYSHGLNRFNSFLKSMSPDADGVPINIHATPELVSSFGVMEQYDGCMGVGPYNAHFSMERAIELAQEHGVGCVSLRNTNHWQRGGAYGLQAADAGMIGICWTNTTGNMPPWGSAEVKIGNNPIVFCVPRENGEHVLLDMATSQFANGKLEILKKQGETLALPGGYNAAGELTQDPSEILETKRALPIGFWKGSGLTIVLDMIAAALAGGQTTHEIQAQGAEYAVSQVYLAIAASKLGDLEALDQTVSGVIDDLHSVEPLVTGGSVSYPGEGMVQTRAENLAMGVPVDKQQWEELQKR